MEPRYEYVLVGGGVTSVWAAQNIREIDKEGKIVIIGLEPHSPYDRPPLSKNFLVNDDMAIDDPYSKLDEFYPKNRVELHTATRVTGIDRASRTVTLENGKSFQYGKLLLATGSSPRPLAIPGADRTGVYLLRSIEDSVQIRDALRHTKRLMIVGAGYIGTEVAASAKSRGVEEVTVIEPQEYPWAKFASPTLGKFVQTYFEEYGVKFVLGDEVASIEGDGDKGPVRRVRTKGGQELQADCVVAGVGVTLNLELAKQAGLEVDEKNGVRVNEFLQTSDPNIWAAGDIAFFKDLAIGKEWHAEHFLNAKWQGQAVGKILAGGSEPYDRVPYFFSDEFDIHMCLRGDPQGGKNTVVWGDLPGAEFAELYYDESGRLTTAVIISHDEGKMDEISDTLEPLIRAKTEIGSRIAEIQASGFDLKSLG